MFFSLKIKMAPETVFGLFLRFCLLACAALFMVKVLEEFLNGNTGYATSKESLSQTDIPTVMFCHSRNDASRNIAYEKDLYITFVIRRRPDYKSVKLVLNRKVETLYGLNISLTRLEGYFHFCYKITSLWNGEEPIGVQGLSVFLSFYFINQAYPKEAVFAFTSEENSYGMLYNRWFDGLVDGPITLNFGQSSSIEIVEVIEYSNLDTQFYSTCSQDSYYHCLVKRFSKLDFNLIKNTTTYNGVGCPFRNICLPNSLPEDQIPLCDNVVDLNCYHKVLQELKSTQQENCKKLCLAKEFKTMSRTSTSGIGNGYSLRLNFGTPKCTIDTRSDMPFKTVKREYWIMSWLSLIGNVGGTLGMFVGFSVITTAESAMTAVAKFWRWLTIFSQNKKTNVTD